MKQAINCCPVCSLEAPSEIKGSSGGDWYCQKCNYQVDTRILPDSFLDEMDVTLETDFSNLNTDILIEYCPACRHKSDKPFFIGTIDDSGGEWVCEQCDQFIEAFVVGYEDPTEKMMEERDPFKKNKNLLFFIVVSVVVVLYILFIYVLPE